MAKPRPNPADDIKKLAKEIEAFDADGRLAQMAGRHAVFGGLVLRWDLVRLVSAALSRAYTRGADDRELPARALDVINKLGEVKGLADEIVKLNPRTEDDANAATQKAEKLDTLIVELLITAGPAFTILTIEELATRLQREATERHNHLTGVIQKGITERLAREEAVWNARNAEQKDLEQRLAAQLSQQEALIKQASEALVQTRAAEANAQEIVKSLTILSETAVEVKYAEVFKTTGETYQGAARNWLIATVVIAVIAVMFLGVLLYLLATSTFEPNVEIIVLNVSLLSILYTALVFSAKNYRINLHNAAVNIQKRDALLSLLAFYKAAPPDEAVRAAILSRVTEMCFSIRNTGFSAEDIAIQLPAPISEAITSARSAVKP